MPKSTPSSSTPARRTFVDWSVPLLAAAADELLRPRIAHGEADLSRVVCVLPGARAGRLLLAQLIHQAAETEAALIPPRIVTPGVAATSLLELAAPLASMSEMRLGWLSVLERARDDELLPILGDGVEPTPADREALAEMLLELTDTLAAGEKTFADVARVVDDIAPPAERQRWRALGSLETKWLALLDGLGLGEPMRAARDAAQRDDVKRDIEQIALIGVVELNARQRRVIGRLADRTVAFIHAPQSLADRFDEFGCARVDAWEEIDIDLNDARIHFADRPRDQAACALRALDELNRQHTHGHSLGAVAVGLGDPALQPTLLRCAEWAGVSLHPAAGVPLAASAPILLLQRAAAWLEDRRFADLAALLRLPDVERILARLIEHEPTPVDAGDDRPDHADPPPDSRLSLGVAHWLGIVEKYFADHLQSRCTGQWLPDRPEVLQTLSLVHDAVARMLSAFDDRHRPLGEWCGLFNTMLGEVFGDLGPAHRDRARTVAACIEISAVLADLASVDPRLQPMMAAPRAMRYVLRRLERAVMTLPSAADDIDLLGWLELHLDPSENLIVLGMNDGAIPSTMLGHAFLPDSLRRTLGLPHNGSRVARDACLLTSMMRTRRSLHLIVGRRGPGDEPLAPSRLLFRAGCGSEGHHQHHESTLQRVRAFCESGDRQPQSTAEAAAALRLPPPAVESRFVVPDLPSKIEPPASMRITDFALYLACPYRYALARLLKLERLEPGVDELDARTFGGLAHAALESFGRGPLRDSTDPDAIDGFLRRRVDEIALETFGRTPPPAVAVQIAHLKQRLRDFSRRQASWRADGWQIRACELTLTDNVSLDIPEQTPMPLRGRIDRIDFNPDSGLCRIIDYKTGDTARPPHLAHHGRKRVPQDPDGRWRDLQLPLYWFGLREMNMLDDVRGVEMGYVVLPRETGGAAFLRAEWDDALLAEAVNVARDVVRAIRAGRFEMNPDHAGYSDFARLCHTTVLGGARLADAEPAANGAHA